MRYFDVAIRNFLFFFFFKFCVEMFCMKMFWKRFYVLYLTFSLSGYSFLNV